MAKKLTPLYDRVIVKTIEEDEVSDSGLLVIPDAAKEKPQRGLVVAVGPGRDAANPSVVKPGDEVLFGRYTGSEIKIGASTYLIMKEDEIFTIIQDV